jgi:hypothetical protein
MIMPAIEPYDMVPHSEINELKRQLQELRSKSQASSSHELLNSMSALTNSMNSMLKLFSEAADELKLEEKQGTGVSKRLDPIDEKLETIISQNKVIAEGMVAISDMIKDIIDKKHKPMPKPFARPEFNPEFKPPEPFPSFDQGQGFDHGARGPGPQGPVPMPSMPFSNLEPKKPKKKGLFGRLKH